MQRGVDPRRFSTDESHTTKKDTRNKKTGAPEVESTEASPLDDPASPSYQTHHELSEVAIVETKGNGSNNDEMSDTVLNVNQQPESNDPTKPTSANTTDDFEKPMMSQTNDDEGAHNNTESNDVTAKKTVDNNELLPTESLVAPVSIKLNRPISLNPKSPGRSPPRRSQVLDMPHGSPVRSLVSRFEKKEVKSLDALPFRTVRGFFSDERSIHVSTEKEKYDALVEKQRQEALLRSPMGGKRTPRSHRFPPPAFSLDDDEDDQRSEADELDAKYGDMIIRDDAPESSQVDVVANDNQVASVEDTIQQLEAEIVEPAENDISQEEDESQTVEQEILESFGDSNQLRDETRDEGIADMTQKYGVRDEEIVKVPEAEDMNDVAPPPPSEEPQKDEHDRSQIIETPEQEVKKRPILTTERSFVMEDDHTIETEDMIVVGERLSSSGAEDDFFARDYTMEQLEQDFRTVPIQNEGANDCKSPAKRFPKKSAIKKPEVRSKLFAPTSASLASRTMKNPQSVKKEKSQPVKPLYVPSPAATPTKNRYANVQSKVKGMIEAPVSVRKGSTSSDSNISVSSPASSTRSAHTPVRPRRTPQSGSASVDRRSFEKTGKLNRPSLGSIRSDDAHSDGGDYDDNGGSSPSNRPLKSGAALTSRKVRYDDVQPRYLDYTKKSTVYMRNQEEQLERRRRLEEASALRSAERQNQLRAKDKSRFDYNEEVNPRRQTHIGTPSRQIIGQTRVARARASSSSATVSIAIESDESAPVA